MALYDMTSVTHDGPNTQASLIKVDRTTFAHENIQERAHLQAALRDHIDLIDDRLFVVAEEFGDFEGANRRIDLLCIDREGKLVVVELKRTADGGHMELQALRYAAMISTMTFAQVVRASAKYRRNRGLEDASEGSARTELLSWLELSEDEEPDIPREVGIVLASENFSQEVTTTVLWLNEFHSFDITCIRMSPYKLGERLLLDVQPVIPLPEASAYTVRVREKEIAVKQAAQSTADWTQFIVQTPTDTTQPLPKRWAILRLVEGLAAAGTPMEQIQQLLPASKVLHVDGVFADPDELWEAVKSQRGKSEPNRQRWHLDSPIVQGPRTWVLGKNWGSGTRGHFKDLLAVAPPGFNVTEEEAPAAPLN